MEIREKRNSSSVGYGILIIWKRLMGLDFMMFHMQRILPMAYVALEFRSSDVKIGIWHMFLVVLPLCLEFL